MLLLVLGLIPVCLGDREGGMSESENRMLQGAPAFSLSAWFDGTFADQLETFLSDQMLGRDNILSVSRGILDVFNVMSEKDRIVNADIDEELNEMANAGGTEADTDEAGSEDVVNVAVVLETTPAPIDDGTDRSDGGKSFVGYEVPDDPGIDHIVQLLKKISDKKRKSKS